LAQLAGRVRWKRWLARLTRSAGLIALTFLLVYGIDLLFDLDTMTLRGVNVVLLLGAVMLVVNDFYRAWFSRLDMVGVAQMLEKCFPDLAERLVTLVQVQDDPSSKLDPEFVYFLGIETERQLASTSLASACPLHRERRLLVVTAVVLAALFGGLSYEPSFDEFSERFATAWLTPTDPTLRWPFRINLASSESFGSGMERIECDGRVIELSRLDRHAFSFAVDTIQLTRDKRRKWPPTKCWLVCDDGAGGHTKILMTPLKSPAAGQFTCEIVDPSKARSYWAQTDEVFSRSALVVPIDRPTFAEAPTVAVTAPRYTNQRTPELILLEANGDAKLDLLRFSRMQFAFSIKPEPSEAWLRVKKMPASEHEVAEESIAKVDFAGEDHRALAEIIAAQPGDFQAELVVEIAQNLCVVLPVGQWTVHDDQVPRFTQPARVTGAGDSLMQDKEHKIAPGDRFKVQTVVEDREGLDAVAVELRVNDGPVRMEAWKRADGKKLLAINDWLPIPAGLKDGDRVQFRLLASDNRRLKKGEIVQTKKVIVPAADLAPQVATWPAAIGGAARWITLHVDRSIGGLVKVQVQAQADEVRDSVAKIRQKLVAEAQQLEKLQGAVHRQAALAPEQKQQADKIRKLNREITEDLLRAGERFAANPELATIADHFFDIAETEMLRVAEALYRFSEKDRPLAEGEKDLKASQAAVQQALKKLDRMNDVNKLLAQDRLDQWQIEKLAHRQENLAQQLKNLLANEPLSDAELAQQIEAIRQEQARLAEERTEIENQNALVKESAEALAQKEVQRLAQAAEQLAAEQGKMRGLDPAKMPAESKDRPLADKADKLAADLLELAQKAIGPEAKAMAKESADALAQAKKAMDASEAMKAKGETEQSRKAEDEALAKLDIVVKKLAKLAQDQAMKQSVKEGAEKTAEALKEGGTLMKTAQDNLPAMPKDAQTAMRGAAEKLAQAAALAQRQASRHLPKVVRNPAAKTAFPLGGAVSGAASRDTKLEAFQGRTWGELPGELKTRLMQDFRSRFGEEYADLIQQYFERLAETSPAPRIR
jgi:hypothetical protein